MKQIKYFSTAEYGKKLNFSSLSASHASTRQGVFDKVMDNVEAVRSAASRLGLFSSSMDMNGSDLGVGLKEVTFEAILDSFSGYLAIERPLSQMRELLVYRDKVTKGSGRKVLPLLGKAEPREFSSKSKTHTVPASNKDITVEFGKSIVPGSVSIKATINGKETFIIDDRQGNLLAKGNVLEEGTVNYSTGQLKCKTIENPIQDDKLVITYTEDHLVADQEGRIKPKEHYFEIVAKVNKFEFEYDIIQAAISEKTLGSNTGEDMKAAVRTEYTMNINNELVRNLKEGYSGTTLTINLSTFSVAAGMLESLLQTFTSGLISVDSALGKKTTKAVQATAYVVGLSVGDLFMSLKDDTYWVPNNTQYVDGLLGFYKGRAVLQHTDVADNEGYAVHKTKDGQLAPLGYGIFLPATDLPLVGNFANTNEVAGGIYSVEGINLITSDLVQKFKVSLPADWMQVA